MKKCRVLPNSDDWKVIVESRKETVFFIDENARYISTVEFTRVINQNPNYFVIITRNPLPNLTYSYEEIYGFREKNKYRNAKRVFNETYHIYKNDSLISYEEINCVLTEDQKSGFQFFNQICDEKFNCISAGGKDNILNMLYRLCASNIGKFLIIADGAAFGAVISDVYYFIEMNGGVLYLPESFEWLILQSKKLNLPKLNDVLENTWDYVDSEKYLSWERFFTDYLEKNTQDTPFHYTKSRLNEAYLTQSMQKAILKDTPIAFLLEDKSEPVKEKKEISDTKQDIPK